METDRRALLGGIGALAALGALPAGARAAPPSVIAECDHRDVTLLDGIAQAQARRTLDALLAMDEDALLRPFRQAAGMETGASGFGGWYDASPHFDPPRDMHGFIPGHSFGQYVSALSRGYAASGDARARAKVDRLLAAFGPAITPDFYRDYPLPAYTYDKIVVGLIDAHQFAGHAGALSLLRRATEAVLPSLPGKALDRQVVERQPHRNPAFGWDETYTLPENLYLAADRGAGDSFRAMARQYLLDGPYFDPLAAGRNVLPHRHAYSHMNALASAMRAYLTDGDTKYLAAARNGFQFVQQQSFATGGWGPNEGFIEPGSGGLGDSLTRTHAGFEAPCGSYGHFKVARYLMRATGDSRYGDSMERLFYNAALGLLPLKPDGTAFYYADYNDIGAKTYFDYACPCCSGTIGQLTADYGLSAYLRDESGLYVNLYTPSRVVWHGRGAAPVTLTQTGGYPLANDVAMRIAVPRPTKMALRLRIPAWAGGGTRLAVNGRAVDVVPGRFAMLQREWRDGDRIDLRVDMPLRAEPVDDQHPERVAMVQGPLALFATGDRFMPYRAEQLLALRQTSPGAPHWTMPADGGGQIFQPWFAIEGGATRLYQYLA